MYPKLKRYCDKLRAETHLISTTRKAALLAISQYIQHELDAKRTPQLTVICTHNSRRSHIGQLWLAAAATYWEVPRILTYSGGTEATAFHPNAIAALERAGFAIRANQPTDNPHYQVSWRARQLPEEVFSKKYDAAPNPLRHFAAILVCTEADESCPSVRGASARFALPYDDPKIFDNTPLESQKYDERVREIGREMLYLISTIRKNKANE